MMRQIAGALAEYEKALLIAKLRHARDRIRAERGAVRGGSRPGRDHRRSPEARAQEAQNGQATQSESYLGRVGRAWVPRLRRKAIPPRLSFKNASLIPNRRL